MLRLRMKRVYAPPSKSDGRRILVDRLWPRGLSREAAVIHYWAKAIAPSDELRRWYGHEPAKWRTFRSRYFEELDEKPEALEELRAHFGRGATTFLFSSKETDLNNARALLEYFEEERG